jgi:hypothetical protein
MINIQLIHQVVFYERKLAQEIEAWQRLSQSDSSKDQGPKTLRKKRSTLRGCLTPKRTPPRDPCHEQGLRCELRCPRTKQSVGPSD